MDGTPARLMMARLMIRVSQLSPAYSLKYTAAATPMGTEINNATITSQMVPNRAGKMPPAVMPLVGLVNKKSTDTTEPPL